MPKSSGTPFSAVAAPLRPRLADVIVEQIEQLIVEGQLAPGEKLPSERDLAEKLSVSRPSVREALLKTEARGLIEVTRGGGFAVRDVTAPTVAEPLAHLLNRHPKAANDFLEMRHGLEAMAARLAAQRATDADLRKLKQALEAMATTRVARDSTAGADADARFHLAVAEASHNVALMHVTRGIFVLMRAGIQGYHDLFYGDDARRRRVHEQHRAIYAAIAAHDARAAQAAAHGHLDFVQGTLTASIAGKENTAARR
jgi:GntR family transcriptional regulator, transcriptional repressor for pyruvate dehydrogenase complex